MLLVHGYAVYTDIPLRRVEDSGKQLDQRALPRAVLADDRDELAWFYIQVVRKRGNSVGLATRYVKETFSSSIIALRAAD